MMIKRKDPIKFPQNIEAVLFDLDGTVVDSMWMWPQIDKDFLEERGFSVPEGLKADLDGLSMREDAVYFRKRFHLSDSEDELINIWNDMALHHYEEDVPLQPGVREFIFFLKKKRIKTGVVTSNSRVLCEAALEANDVIDLFDTMVTSEDVEHGKPDPEGYLLAANRLGAEPHDCLVFEDLPAGLIAAEEAGMSAIAFDDDYSKVYEDDKIAHCDFMIKDYRELME